MPTREAWRGIRRTTFYPRQARSARFHAVFLITGVTCAVLLAYAILGTLEGSLSVHVYWAGAVSTAVFGATQLVWRSCRPRWRSPICPLNWALFVLFLQSVILPLLITCVGPTSGTLPYLPSEHSINAAILVNALGYFAFCVGCQVSRVRPTGRPRPLAQRMPTVALDVCFAALGLLGFYLAFGESDTFIRLLTNPASRLGAAAQSATVAVAAGTVLRPFLLTAVVLAWCRWVDVKASGASAASRLSCTTLAAIAVILIGVSFGFNRAAFLVPLVAMAAAYSARARRSGLAMIAIVALLAIGAGIFVGDYRNADVVLDEVLNDSSVRQLLASKMTAVDQLQVYGMAPQFLGFMLEAEGGETGAGSGRMLLSSLMYPVPVVGKAFRESSGVTLYNRMIYGDNGTLDQVVPFQGELFLSFHLAGVFVGFVAVGLVIARLQRAFERSRSAMWSYICQYTATWAAFLIQGSLAVVSQIFVFFFWPIYVLVLWRWVAQRLGPGPTES